MSQLQTLDLSHNLIESVPIIQSNHHLNIILSYNLINYIQLNDEENNYDLSFNPICTLEKLHSNENLVFQHITQLHCDCRLAFFLEDNLENTSEIIGINQPFGNETKCSTPLAVHDLFLKDLTYEQLLVTCTDDLPMNCREVNHFKRIQKYAKDIIGIPMQTTTQSKRID
jgi:Leucine-rich repeat (LRR) protein